MTHRRDAPVGWAAFRVFRQTPAPMFVHRHGNWRHGYYAKQGRVDRLQLRMAIAVLRGRWSGSLPWSPEPTAPGWAAFRSSR